MPEEVPVVGVDDIRLAAYTSPALTTIRQPAYEMGRCATKLLIDAVHGQTRGPGQPVVLEGALIVRTSSVPMAAAQQAETV